MNRIRLGWMVISVVALWAQPAFAGWPSEVKPLRISGGKASDLGDLSRGKKIDLGFASHSDIACWPATRNEHFTGKHVFYSVSLPARSELTIKATPRDSATDVSLYAYTMGTTRTDIPPALSGVVSCEASFGTKSKKASYNPGSPETVTLAATTNPYNVVIAVAGARGAGTGHFKVDLELKTAAAAPTGKITQVKRIVPKPGGKVKVSSRLNGGTQVALGWAANSSVACWPSTSDDHFDGNHQLFELDLPAYSEVTVRAIPKKKNLDLSLYAYTVGTSSIALPPNVTSVVSCEASFGTKSIKNRYNPGEAETVALNATKNPYKMYIGVAGAQEVTKGAFTLEVELSKPPEAEPTTKISKAKKLSVARGSSTKVSGRIDKGARIALGWASQSSVACWPATKNDQFDGNHVVYATNIPPESNMVITLTPKAANLDLNLYAYEIGDERLPPDVPSAVSCEASYGTNKISEPFNPGLPETVSLTAIKNPYKVYIGVAGAQKVTKGAFDLEVKITPR